MRLTPLYYDITVSVFICCPSLPPVLIVPESTKWYFYQWEIFFGILQDVKSFFFMAGLHFKSIKV